MGRGGDARAFGLIVLAFSGGLDTRCAVAWLTEQGLEVHAYTADLAQPDEASAADIPSPAPKAA